VSDFRTFYVSIGNSDDKLPQQDWARFAGLVVGRVRRAAREVFGVWWSAPDVPFQNACVGFSLHSTEVIALQNELTELRREYAQNSIAWAEVAGTVMI
jgi:hypothetical protein